MASNSAVDAPIPKFPMFLPHRSINTAEFESGFEEELVVGGITSNVIMCSICRGLPRKPAAIKQCGHLYCEACIGQHFRRNQRQQSVYSRVMVAPCPYCQKTFRTKDVRPYECLSALAKLLLNDKMVRCPHACGYQGSFHEVDTHQVYQCSLRTIQCPNESCIFEGPAGMLEREHYPKCEYLRIHCPKCKLPVLASEMDEHVCLDAMKRALASMLPYQLLPYVHFFIGIPRNTDPASFFSSILECTMLLHARDIMIPDDSQMGQANHSFTSETRYVRRKRLFPRMEVQEDIRLQGLRRRHDFEQRMAERTAQEAAANSAANAPADNGGSDSTVVHTLYDAVVHPDAYAAPFPPATYFNFGDNDAPDDEDESELTDALSQ